MTTKMSESLDLGHYIERHRDIQKSAKVGFSRMYLPLLRLINPEIYQPVKGLYTYGSILDDAVDETEYVRPAINLLDEEIQGFKSDEQTKLQRGCFSQANKLKPSIRNYINKNMIMLLKGMRIDAENRLDASFPTRRKLNKRNILGAWSSMRMFSYFYNGFIPTMTTGVANLANIWGDYDNARDLGEDLTHGLVQIADIDLNNFNIELTPGRELPREQLRGYYSAKAPEISDNLSQASRLLGEGGFDPLVCSMGWIYFQSRRLKLLKIPQIEEGASFLPPKDSEKWNN